MDSRTELRKLRMPPALSALRPAHWSKNLLVFVPLVAGHRFDSATWLRGALAFACFCAAASSGYLINDVLDINADRTLHYKMNRPVASGALGRTQALVLAVVIGLAAAGGAFVLSSTFFLLILAYLAISLAYSYVLKSKIIVDVIVIAGLLSIRVIGGGVASGIVLSNWLIMFCLFLFFSLSLAKRCSEIVARSGSGATAIPRRGYRTTDVLILTSMGTAAAYAAILVFVQYIASPEVKTLYSRVDWLWLAVPFLIYWLSRIFLVANRGELNEDPIIFALFDRVTWAVGLCLAVVFAVAI